MFTFFQGSTHKKAGLPLLPSCTTCRAFQSCNYGKQVSTHQTAKTVYVIDAPTSDSQNSLNTEFPKRWEQLLERAGINPSRDAVLAAAACPGAKEGAWSHCQPLLISEIKRLNPEKIVILGKDALQSVIKWLWKEPAGMQERWYGQRIPCRELNAWIMPIGRKRYYASPEVSDVWTYRHLRQVVKTTGRPYAEVPDYDKQYQITSAAETRKALAWISDPKNVVTTAFDYETTGLKPENPGQEIVTCSVAYLTQNGRVRAIAFRVTVDVIAALINYLQSPVPKIAANLKFEERWSHRILGTRVKGWQWDTMVAAHIDDPQKQVAGLKFGAFAHLGVPFYAGEVEQYFDDVNPATGLNSIFRADLTELLAYNAIDALAELDLGVLQMRAAGIKTMWTNNLPLKSHYSFE